MTFLELVQDFMREAGMSGTIASVQAQTGEAQRAVNWIIKAYRSIQNEHSDWEFLRADVTFGVNAPLNTYTTAAAGVTSFGEWRFRGDDWRCYNTAMGVADEQPVAYVDYAKFRTVYGYSTQRLQTGRPKVVTQRPDQSLQFWPTPDTGYTIVGEQYQAPVALVNNTDFPVFAAKFHDVIVYRALMLYGQFEGDGGVFTYAQAECARILGMMEDQYLPKWEASEPMA
jgi:hypothetical protein